METKTKYCIPRIKGSQLSCTLVGALSVLFNLKGTAVLLHGTTGCAHFGMKFCHQMMRRKQELLPNFRPLPLNFSTTALSENELIFGGEQRLRAKIREMAEAFPHTPLMVVPSCTVEVIGDNAKEICHEMSKETGTDIFYFNMGGFLKGDHYQGLNSAYFDLIDQFLTPCLKTEPTRVNLVAERNLMATAEMDFSEVCRLLALLGLRVNTRFVHALPFSSLGQVTRAALNLPAVKNQAMAVCDRLYQKFGMPYIDQGFPCGLTDTGTWLNAICKALDIDADIQGLMADEQAFVRDQIERLGNPFKGMTIVINTVPIHLGWLVEFLDLVQARLLEINLLDSGYFQSDFLDRMEALPCRVNPGMRMEEIMERNQLKLADLYLQCSVHTSPMPLLQPGILVKEVPMVPPVGPRGLLDLFINWSQWMRPCSLEGWRNELLDKRI